MITGGEGWRTMPEEEMRFYLEQLVNKIFLTAMAVQRSQRRPRRRKTSSP